MLDKSKGLVYLRWCVLLSAEWNPDPLQSRSGRRVAALHSPVTMCRMLRSEQGGETRLNKVQAAHEAEEGVTFKLPVKQLQVVAAMVTVCLL